MADRLLVKAAHDLRVNRTVRFWQYSYLWSSLVYLTKVILASVALYLIKMLGIEFKITYYITSRIGHYAADFFIDYAESKVSSPTRPLLVALSHDSSNRFLDKMVSREFIASPALKPFLTASHIMPGLRSFYQVPPIIRSGSRDTKSLNSLGITPRFTQLENDTVMTWLSHNGWQGHSQPLVLLNVRDKAYLSSIGYNSSDLNYHAYRDADITTFLPSVDWLVTSKNAFIVRVGKSAEKPIKQFVPYKDHIVDMPFLPQDYITDLACVWLHAHADLAISTGSGPDVITQAFNRNLVLVGCQPLAYIPIYSRSYVASKRYIWKNTQMQLTIKEYLKNSFINTTDIINAGILVQDLTDSEILTIIQRAWERLHNEDFMTQAENISTSIYLDELQLLGNIDKQCHKISPMFTLSPLIHSR